MEAIEKQAARGIIVWLTGISAAGKSTLARACHQQLEALGYAASLLDSDRLRREISPDLGFSAADRELHVHRMAMLAADHARRGQIAIVAAISPFRSGREDARAAVDMFLEVFVDAPLAVCEQRDRWGCINVFATTR